MTLIPPHPCVIAAETQGSVEPPVQVSVLGRYWTLNHGVYSLGVPAVFPELTEELVFMAAIAMWQALIWGWRRFPRAKAKVWFPPAQPHRHAMSRVRGEGGRESAPGLRTSLSQCCIHLDEVGQGLTREAASAVGRKMHGLGWIDKPFIFCLFLMHTRPAFLWWAKPCLQCLRAGPSQWPQCLLVP